MSGDLPISLTEEDRDKSSMPERFENGSQVRDLCQAMIASDRKRSALRERVDGLLNGYSSIPKAALDRKGFGWFPRVNYRGLEGAVSAQTTPLFDLVTEVDHCIEITLDIKAESAEQRDSWEESIQKHFTWLLFNRWRKSFNFHLPLSQKEMIVHGMGYHVWPQKNNWMPRTPRGGQILFPDACSLDFEKDGKYFCLREFVPGEDVYQFIRNEDTARKLGFSPDNIWSALVKAQKQNRRSNSQSINRDEIQRKYRRGDIGYSQSSQTGLWFNWVPVVEYDGGISLYAIEENISTGNKDKGYLFRKRFMFDEWPLVMFPYDNGNGDIHSVRGLGVRAKDFFELQNRLTNAMVAQVLISSFPQVKQTIQNMDPDKLKLMRVGAMSILPYGVDYANMQFPQLNNTGIALSRELSEMAAVNNQASNIGGGAPEPKDRETAYSFGIRTQDAARVSNGMQSLYESNLQQFYYKIYCLVIQTPKGSLPHQKMAQEFRDRCKADGVPDEALKERAIGNFQECTSTGAGSAATRLHNILGMMQYIYPVTTEEKKITIERDLTSALMGGAKVDRYARSINESQIPNSEDSFIATEANGLAQGGEGVVAGDQNHVKHAAGALAKAAQLAQEVQQGQIEPEEALRGLQSLLNHAGEHLQFLQNVPQRKMEFDQLSQQWQELSQFTQQLMAEVEQQQSQPNPEQQLSESGQIGMAKVQQGTQLKAQKQQADTVLKFQKAAFDNRIKDANAAAQIQRTRATQKAAA